MRARNQWSERVLIIFMKYPEAGFVKTRLAKSIGREKAASVYRLLVELLIRRTDDASFERSIFYTPVHRKQALLKWMGGRLKLFPQRGDNLGERESNAFRFAFAKGAHRVILIGADIPFLNNELILTAFRELEKCDCVMGPSMDGGYYLLGLRRFYATLFREIDWGTDKVMSQTLRAMEELGLTYTLLGERFDVDDVEDLVRLKISLSNHRKAGFEDLDLLIDRLEELSVDAE